MPDPLVPLVVLLSEGLTAPTSTPDPGARGRPSLTGRAFADLLADAARHLDAGRRQVDGALASARRGDLSPEQLLAIQAGVYRYTQEVELASKVVDRVTNGIKTVLQSQQ